MCKKNRVSNLAAKIQLFTNPKIRVEMIKYSHPYAYDDYWQRALDTSMFAGSALTRTSLVFSLCGGTIAQS